MAIKVFFIKEIWLELLSNRVNGLKPFVSPLEKVGGLIVKGAHDVKVEIRNLHKIAEDRLQKGV